MTPLVACDQRRQVAAVMLQGLMLHELHTTTQAALEGLVLPFLYLACHKLESVLPLLTNINDLLLDGLSPA